MFYHHCDCVSATSFFIMVSCDQYVAFNKKSRDNIDDYQNCSVLHCKVSKQLNLYSALL